jgi:diadenylate cyclase
VHKVIPLGLSFDILLVVIDLLVVSYLIYRVLLLIRGTRAVQMLFGLAFFIFLYLIAKYLELQTLDWLLSKFFSSLLIVIIVIFQEEIRRGLTKFGISSFFFGGSKKFSDKVIEDITLVADELAKQKIGAIIVIQREVGLDEFIEDHVTLDSIMSRKLLISIFQKNSPLHDGAVVIDGESLRAAGCVLPLSFDPDLDPNLGTRHRAALGLSERSDAIVVVVSEETGTISLVHDSNIFRNLDLTALQDQLDFLLNFQNNSAVNNSKNSGKSEATGK